MIYVRAGASGTGDGSSWPNAYTSLADALSAASSGSQIWVAAGTYRPSATGDRAASFTLKDDVALYGGFAGSETALAQRDWTANITILSGDLSGDDGANFANDGENSYHVVTGADGATLDGFRVSGGNADADDEQSVGGGIYNLAAGPTLAHLTISGNHAGNGGGMYNDGSPTLTSVTFSGNSANDSGAGLYNNASSPTIIDCAFTNNTTAVTGSYLGRATLTVLGHSRRRSHPQSIQ